MILRVLMIAVAGVAAWALWFGYGELKILRGTLFWDYRYIVFAALGFLGLSGLEWLVHWIGKRIEGDQDSH